jgi:hypothetical protein
VTTYTVHHQEDAAFLVDPVAILVAVAQESGIGSGAAVHRLRSELRLAKTKTTTNARTAITNGVCRL